MGQSNYRVIFEDFTTRHYIKAFRKAHKNHWDKTSADIVMVCERIDNALQYDRVDLISTAGSYKLLKLDFAIEGTRISPKASGNRCILLVDEENKLVRVLLVYSKNHIAPPNETQKWKSIIKVQYPEIGKIFNL